jgi:uncharacterized membrane protein YraQ (UPF0718 family)
LMMWVVDIFEQFWQFLVEAAPWLLLGFLFAGLLKAFVPSEVILRYVGRGNVRSILIATLIGIPLPLCSCGVIPTGMALYQQGASRAATLAFLIATPATTVTAILLTLGMLGGRFTAAYIIAAFVVAIITGLLSLLLLREGPREAFRGTAACGCDPGNGETSCAVGETAAHEGYGLKERVKTTFRYGFIDMGEDVGHWILIGLAAAAIIAALVPESYIGEYLGGGLSALVIMAAVATPIYICSTASVPFVAALVVSGMNPAAGLVFLLLGPATNLSTVLVIGKSMGKATVALYLISIMLLSIAMAYLFSFVGWL